MTINDQLLLDFGITVSIDPSLAEDWAFWPATSRASIRSADGAEGAKDEILAQAVLWEALRQAASG